MAARTIATAAFFLLAAERVAFAAPPAVDLTIDDRAKGCPSAEELRAEVGRQIGDDEMGPAPRVDVRIDVEPDGSLAARLGLAEDPTRTQTLRAPARACRDLTSAAAIAVSLVLRAAARAHPLPPPPPPPAPPPPPRLVPPPAPLFRHSLAAGFVLGKGVVPDVAGGALLSYGLRYRRYFGVVIDGSATAAERADGAHDSAVRVTSRALSLAPCGYLALEFGCVFFSAGDIAGTGEHVRQPTTKRFADIELGYRVGVRIPMPEPFRLRVELRNGFLLVRSDLRVDGDTVWRSPPVTLTGAFSLETSF